MTALCYRPLKHGDSQLGYNWASFSSLGVSGKHLMSVIPKLQQVRTLHAGDVRVTLSCRLAILCFVMKT